MTEFAPMRDPSYVIVPYDPEWPRRFEAEKTRLLDALGAVAVRIEHVGSTSVPGLAAKPIVDIDIFVENLDDMSSYRAPLERLGYIFVPDPDTPDLHFFPWPAAPPRRFHVHVAQVGSPHERDLAVRGFLRAHPEACREYEAVKRSITSVTPGEPEVYVSGKAAFMTELVERALRWRRSLRESS